MTGYEAHNLRRLLARFGLTIDELAERANLDRRTILGIVDGTSNPHSQTISSLAKGLGVSADEFFLDPSQLLYRHFDELFPSDRVTSNEMLENLDRVMRRDEHLSIYSRS